MNNSRLFRFSNVFIAVGVASGLLINNAFAAETPKEATQYTQEINQQYAKSLPLATVRILKMPSVGLSHRY